MTRHDTTRHDTAKQRRYRFQCELKLALHTINAQMQHPVSASCSRF